MATFLGKLKIFPSKFCFSWCFPLTFLKFFQKREKKREKIVDHIFAHVEMKQNCSRSISPIGNIGSKDVF